MTGSELQEIIVRGSKRAIRNNVSFFDEMFRVFLRRHVRLLLYDCSLLTLSKVRATTQVCEPANKSRRALRLQAWPLIQKKANTDKPLDKVVCPLNGFGLSNPRAFQRGNIVNLLSQNSQYIFFKKCKPARRERLTWERRRPACGWSLYIYASVSLGARASCPHC